MKPQSIVIGDWSHDGHGLKEHFLFTSNKTDSELRDAFRKSCNLTGYVFDVNGPLPNGQKPKARLLCQCEDCWLKPEVLDDFVNNFGLIDPRISEDAHPIFEGDSYDDENGLGLGTEECFKFIMWFII